MVITVVSLFLRDAFMGDSQLHSAFNVGPVAKIDLDQEADRNKEW